jgi:signal transduction histidine kinase/ActR/RegA family two-component response regulator
VVEDLRTENEHLRASQAQLEASRDDYVDVFESSPLPSFVLDKRESIHAANEAATELLSQPLSRLVDRRLGSFIVAADRPILAAHLVACAAGRSDTCEVRLRKAAEEDLLVQVCSRQSSRGHSVHTTLVDLSEREHDKVVSAQLREAIASARQASAAKDKFIAMLSHELRTPLTPVLLAASAFRERRELPSHVRKVFGMVARSIELECRLVDDLLDVTRIAQGKMRVERISTDLHAILRRVCEALAPEMHEKHQSLWTELKAERALAEVDPARIHQLFANLLRNAVKFSPSGGEIQVRSWNTGSKIIVEIEDNGIGIDPEELPRLFEPFSQLEQADAPAIRNAGGLGLGLAISKGIVDLHGGRLEATSRGRGLGSRFVVQLPTTTRPAARIDRVAAPGSLQRTDHGKYRVLLVEDDRETAQAIAELLRAEGYDVHTAATIRDALAADIDKVDVIVSDIGLPDGDGRDLIRRLQESHHHPAIALSGFGMDSDLKENLDAGFDINLTKPVDFDTLVGTIRGLIPKAEAVVGQGPSDEGDVRGPS